MSELEMLVWFTFIAVGFVGLLLIASFTVDRIAARLAKPKNKEGK